MTTVVEPRNAAGWFGEAIPKPRELPLLAGRREALHTFVWSAEAVPALSLTWSRVILAFACSHRRVSSKVDKDVLRLMP